ncbi:MAG: histone deacetylase [Flavobacteriales bacterium]|nr:histone deacetylase [Flavobacteriales bacterium]
MRVAFSPIYRYGLLPEGHRFPMDKYDLLPIQLLREGTLEEKDFFHPEPLTEEQILRTHSFNYWNKLKHGTLSRKEIRAMGFPFDDSLVWRGRHIANGTLQCARYAKENGVALNIAGGTHHAYADRGEGFCLFNDIAIASNELIHNGEVDNVLIIDLDVHQGNGTASIFQDNPRVFTFSMHGEHNYPLRKEVSDLDIGVPDGINDHEYLSILEKTLIDLESRVIPDIIFYLSGVDVLKSDKLGRLGMTIEGCRQRDAMVFEFCAKQNIPVAVSMGGGYSVHIKDIIEAHANTFREAKRVFT